MEIETLILRIQLFDMYVNNHLRSGVFHLVRTHLGGVGGFKPPIHFHCVLHAKRGWMVQIACTIAYVLNGRPLCVTTCSLCFPLQLVPPDAGPLHVASVQLPQPQPPGAVWGPRGWARCERLLPGQEERLRQEPRRRRLQRRLPVSCCR